MRKWLVIAVALALPAAAAIGGAIAYRNQRAADEAVARKLGPAFLADAAREGTTADPDHQRRLVLQNRAPDDGARDFIFRAALRRAGQRCDRVTGAVMSSPGRWTVRCAPGYSYRFGFDGSGELVSATRVE